MQISNSLQDYLKIIFDLTKQKKFARIKDISKIKNVSMPSVTEAMRKLSKLGLIEYHAYEIIQLTEKGKGLAHYIFNIHHFLTRFLTDILNLKPEKAESEACKLEHSLDIETLERMVLLYQYLTSCPKVDHSLVKDFKECLASCERKNKMPDICRDCFVKTRFPHYVKQGTAKHVLLKDMKPGEKGNIVMIGPHLEMRKNILKKGIFPGNEIEMIREDREIKSFIVNVDGYNTSVTSNEACIIEVEVGSQKEES